MSIPAPVDAPPSPSKDRPRPAVSARAVGVGIVAAAALCLLTPYNDFKIAASPLSGTQFPLGAIFVLIVLSALVNPLLRRVRPAAAWTPGELLTLWAVMGVSSGLPSSGLMRYLIPHIPAPHYFSDGGNDWEARLWGKTPSWLLMHDKDAARAFFEGYPRGQEHIPWAAWVGPLCAWGAAVFCFLLASFCVANLLRRQWVENERFSFPLVALPVLLAEDPAPGSRLPAVLRDRLLWIAVLLVTVLHTVKGGHLLFPTIPDIVTRYDISPTLTTPPWDQLTGLYLQLFPLVVGLAFLLPVEVSFSLWFFFLVYQFEVYVGASMNAQMPGAQGGQASRQFHAHQALGGGLALLGWTLYAARHHLRDVWEKATNGPRAPEIDDSREMFGYRATMIGLLVAYGGLALWLWAAGVPGPLILILLLTMTLAIFVVAWMVCQAGMLFVMMPYATFDLIAPLVGTAPFPPSALYTMTRMDSIFLADTREMMAPSLLNGMKATESAGVSLKRLLWALLASVAVCTAASLVASLWLPYYNGGGNSLANDWTYRWSPLTRLYITSGVETVPSKPSLLGWMHTAGGFGLVGGLLLARARTGFGLHPIGFLGASVPALYILWSSLLLGWMCKVPIQRYGGMKLYRTALPFFLGLIVGDVLNAVLWVALGYVFGTGYMVMPP